MDTTADTSVAREWFDRHLAADAIAPPISFVYGGRSSAELLAAWPKTVQNRRLDTERTEQIETWTDPRSGLEVRCRAVAYDDFPAIEWTAYFRSLGKADTPILEKIQALDATFQRGGKGEFVLHGNKGDWNTADSYEPYQVTLSTNDVKRIGPRETGKSCDGPDGWPYFNLQMPGRGIIFAVGWPGQWVGVFMRDARTGLKITAGQEYTHLYLKPGEEIRTPLIAMLFWRGTDVARSQNLWRRWFIAHNLPRINGSPPPILAQTHVGGGRDDIAKVNELLGAGIKLNAGWRDALAYVDGEDKGPTWWPPLAEPYHPGPDQPKYETWWNSGTWEIDSSRYPGGFKPFVDWAHSRGLSFILWFEPERVGSPDSWLGRYHREWLLPSSAPLTYGIYPSFDPILDEGNPAARRWLTDHVDHLIKSQGIDWYREDMNGAGPLHAWRKNDTFDRQGMTENRYIQGHLAFWDELRRRNPKLWIDSCASGGRRNDLETMRRSVPLHRCDFNAPDLPGVREATQGHTYGISSWLPYYGLSVRFEDSYGYRSYYMPSFGILVGPVELRKKAYAECRRIAADMLGDYYPLTPYSRELDYWIAWQFDRPEAGEGVVQAFRRERSPASAFFKLHGLVGEAKYELENFDGGRQVRTGAELMDTGLNVTAPSGPAALIFVYKRVD